MLIYVFKQGKLIISSNNTFWEALTYQSLLNIIKKKYNLVCFPSLWQVELTESDRHNIDRWSC